MKIISRAEAKAKGLVRYFTGKACKHGHVYERITTSGGCYECNRPASVFLKRHRARYQCAGCAAQFRPGRADQKYCSHACGSRHWRDSHPDLFAAMQGVKDARRRNPRIAVLGSAEDFEPIYAEARRLTRETGEQYDVDHVVAIRDGGEHSVANLRVLSRSEHARKSATERWR